MSDGMQIYLMEASWRRIGERYLFSTFLRESSIFFGHFSEKMQIYYMGTDQGTEQPRGQKRGWHQKNREKYKTVAQNRVCRERYYMKGEELLSKGSSKHVLTTKIQAFKEGRKTEYTSRDRTRKGTFFRENCLFSKIAPDKIAKNGKEVLWGQMIIGRADNYFRCFLIEMALFGGGISWLLQIYSIEALSKAVDFGVAPANHCRKYRCIGKETCRKEKERWNWSGLVAS